FGAALLVSVSGTGILVLAAFAVSMTIGLGPRRAAPLLAVAVAAAVMLLAVGLLLPEIATTLLDRIGEFSSQDTSANQRFVAAFTVLEDAFRMHPWAVLTGIGPGTAEHLDTYYRYLPNTVTKYIIEYGILGFGLYLGMVLLSERTHRQHLLLL